MQNDRRKELESIFREMDTNHDNLVTKKELYTFLDSKNGNVKYDREIADQLWERMDVNNKN